ncbi:MAG: response regulator [Planctomycetota bacterium]|nr:response regulator [Planctomycetota bacterium]
MQSVPTDVLIVDDESQVCKLLCNALSEAGVACTTATGGLEAKKLLKSGRFSVMVTDAYMPDMNGLDLLKYASRNVPECRVVLITGVSSTRCLARAITLGAYDYLQKPLEMRSFVETVQRALSKGAPQTLPVKAALAIQREGQVRQLSLEVIRALVHAVEAKDPYTRRHSEHVTHYATHLARQLSTDPEVVEAIRIASLVHDIGKIGVPDHILTKPGKLSSEEFEQIRRHPLLGARIVENVSMFSVEAQLVRHHHECWNGSGYPDGLTGETIPFGARIINIADSIDAMLMRRTYKPAYSVEQMLDEMARCAGSQFAPDLVNVADKWCREHVDELILPGKTIEAGHFQLIYGSNVA